MWVHTPVNKKFILEFFFFEETCFSSNAQKTPTRAPHCAARTIFWATKTWRPGPDAGIGHGARATWFYLLYREAVDAQDHTFLRKLPAVSGAVTSRQKRPNKTILVQNPILRPLANVVAEHRVLESCSCLRAEAISARPNFKKFNFNIMKQKKKFNLEKPRNCNLKFIYSICTAVHIL